MRLAQVVLNRVRHPAYPKSVCGVVYQGAERRTGCQFSFTCDGSLRYAPEPGLWRQAQEVARRALAGHVVAEAPSVAGGLASLAGHGRRQRHCGGHGGRLRHLGHAP